MILGNIRRLQRSQGFTLLEIIIAVSILGTVILSVFAIYSQTLIQIRRAKNRTFATQAAQMMMEKIRSSPVSPIAYHDLGTDSEGISGKAKIVITDLLHWKEALNTSLTEATGRISVTDDVLIADDGGKPLCLQIRVSVTYRDHGRYTTSTLVLSLEKT